MPDNAATIAKLSDSEGDAARVEESKKLSFDSSEDDASSGEDGEEGPDFVAISRLHPEYTSGARLAGFSICLHVGSCRSLPPKSVCLAEMELCDLGSTMLHQFEVKQLHKM